MVFLVPMKDIPLKIFPLQEPFEWSLGFQLRLDAFVYCLLLLIHFCPLGVDFPLVCVC